MLSVRITIFSVQLVDVCFRALNIVPNPRRKQWRFPGTKCTVVWCLKPTDHRICYYSCYIGCSHPPRRGIDERVPDPNDQATLEKLKLDKSQIEDAITINVTGKRFLGLNTLNAESLLPMN